MQKREWERLLKAHVVPRLAASEVPVTVHGGYVLVGDVGWTAPVIWWMQQKYSARAIRVAATIVEMPNDMPTQPELWQELGHGQHAGRTQAFDIPEDPEGEAAVMSEIADVISGQGMAFIRQFFSLDATLNGMRVRAGSFKRKDATRAAPLEQIGYLELARGNTDAGIDALREAETLERPFDNPPYPSHRRARILPVLDIAECDAGAVRQLLADRAIAKAKQMKLPKPSFNPPV